MYRFVWYKGISKEFWDSWIFIFGVLWGLSISSYGIHLQCSITCLEHSTKTRRYKLNHLLLLSELQNVTSDSACKTGLNPQLPFKGGASIVIYSNRNCSSTFDFKELSSWLYASLVLYVYLMPVPFLFGILGRILELDCIGSWSLPVHIGDWSNSRNHDWPT